MTRDRTNLVFIGIALLATGHAITAQEPPRSDARETLQSLTPLLGVWERESERDDGTKGIHTTLIQWSADEAYLRMTSCERDSGDSETTRNLGTTLVGWDPESSELRGWVFYHSAQLSGPGSIEDGTLTLSLSGKARASGEESPDTRADVRFEVEGDSLTVRFSNVRMGDQELDDHSLVYARVLPGASTRAGDDSWKTEEWEKLTGSWRAEHPGGGYRIKHIQDGEETLEVYNPRGELVLKSRCEMTIARHQGIAFFTVSNRIRLDTDPPTSQPGTYTSIYKIHDGKWYEQLKGIFVENENLAPDRFLVYSRVEGTGTVAAEVPDLSEAPLGMTRVEYMSVPEGGDEAYLRAERVWKRFHAARRAAGKVAHWAVYRVARTQGDDSDYNYAVVHIFASPEQLAQGPGYAEILEDLDLTEEEQAIYEKTGETRELVRSDFWAVEAVVDPERLKDPSREPARTLTVGLMTSKDAEEHLRLEKAFWSKLWAERVRRGELRNWLLMSRRSGSGPNMIAVMIGPDNGIEPPNIPALLEAAFPKDDPDEVHRQFMKTPQVRDMNAYETWTLVESLDPIEAD